MREIVSHLQTNPDRQFMFFICYFSCFLSDSSKQLLSTLLSRLCRPCLSSCQMLCNTRQQLAQPRTPSRGALNDDLLVQKTHEDIIAVRSRFLSVSLRPPPGRFTAASAAPGQQRAASLCLHNRQEGRRKLNEVSTEHYVNEKVLLSVMTLKRTNTEEDSSSCCLMKNRVFFF